MQRTPWATVEFCHRWFQMLTHILLTFFLTKYYLHRNYNVKYTEWRQTIPVVHDTLTVKAMASFIRSFFRCASMLSVIKCVISYCSWTKKLIVWLCLSCRISTTFLLFWTFTFQGYSENNHEGTSSTEFLLLQLVTLFI